jgi:hypothetical protein
MKKQIFIGALALIMVTACQNQTEEIAKNDPENAINAIKRDAKKPSARMGEPADTSLDPPGPNDAIISCHTPYSGVTGNSCVWSGGKLFNVSWVTTPLLDGPRSTLITTYTATQVSTCNCN